MKKRILLIISLLVICQNWCMAEICHISATGEYTMSDLESQEFAETQAFKYAKQMAVEKAGIYLKNDITLHNYTVTDDRLNMIYSELIYIDDKKVSKEITASDDLHIIVTIQATLDTEMVMKELKKPDEILRDAQEEYYRTVGYEKTIEKENENLKIYVEQNKNADMAKVTKRMKEIENMEASIRLIKDLPTLLDIGKYNIDGSYYVNCTNKAIELNPKNTQAYFKLASYYILNKQYGLAITELNKAVFIDDQYGLAFNYRGICYQRIGRMKESIRDHTKALELDPNNAHAYVMRSQAYRIVNRLDDALKDGEKAIQIRPKYAEAYNAKAAALLEMGKYNEALSWSNQALNLKYKYPFGLYTRTRIYFNLKKYDLAFEDIKMLCELEPNNKYYKAFYNTILKLKGGNDSLWVRDL